MSEMTKVHRVIAQANAVTLSNRPGPRNVEVPADRPGVVIFLHGVNDPGASYGHVETGLCEGLNERLSRNDLRPGAYGVAFDTAKDITHKDPAFDRWKDIKYDPDTYQYQRSESTGTGQATNSILIPFYWGYRAAPSEIKGGETTPFRLRGQYQDIHGNRLSKNFSKGGGMFNNATTNIPEMYGPGFQSSLGNWAASAGMSDYQYSTKSPDRRYFVLAAVRLAMLIREIRRFDPDETITVMAHSQGTIITLLAQAMLAEGKEQGDRCADCIIMVDTPYSLGETAFASLAQPSAVKYTTRGKLNTLINIVKAVTARPHASPTLGELQSDNPLHAGRTGKGWSPVQAKRIDSKDGSTHVFAERDNRGKVYLYFCPEDTTVAIPNIQGIGTYGVPDTIAERWAAIPRASSVLSMTVGQHGFEKRADKFRAMDELKQHRFYQRLWSKGGAMADGKPPAVGKAPECIERIARDKLLGKAGDRTINAEAIVPPYLPNLYGDEAVRGTATQAGLDKPDYVNRNTLLGNPNAKVKTVAVNDVPRDVQDKGSDAVAAWFNGQSPDPEDHTAWVSSLGHSDATLFLREETPNETRRRLESDSKKWDSNSYHSAILRDDNNMRRVAAMDVAIGQAKSLDDPDMRNLLIAIADWKITNKGMKNITSNHYYKSQLSQQSRDLVIACSAYYSYGTFPSQLVPTVPPAMVDKESTSDRMVRR